MYQPNLAGSSPVISRPRTSLAAQLIVVLALAVGLAIVMSACSRDVEQPQDVNQPGADGSFTPSSDDSGIGGSSASTAGAVDVNGIFVPGSCPSDLPTDYEPLCGTVEVPMDWQTGMGSVTLTVAVFPSTATDPAATPVVYLEGGPGGHALETLAFTTEDLLDPLLERGDVVVFDQRGAGLSEPALSCPEVTDATRALEDIPIIEDAASKRRYNDALGACHDRLIASGVDLANFNTVFNAHDVEAVRIALGYNRWNLFGVSYGTKLGLELMRQHPDGLRAVILDSVYPPEVDSVAENPQTFVDAYMKVARACNGEASCASQGDLVERYEELVQELQVSPQRVVVTDFITGVTDEIYLTGDVLVGIVTQALYSPTWFTDLPELATDLERGQTRVAEQFLSQQRSLERYFTDGMFYAISCHEEISFANPAAVVDPPDPFGLRQEFDLASNTGSNAFETCAAFDSGQAPEVANQRVESDVPALLLAGAFDPVTPVAWAESAAAGLSQGSVVVAPNASHGVFGTPCGMSIIVAYLDTPGINPDHSCLVDDGLQFVGAGTAEIELVEVAYPVDPWGVELSTVRPDGWSVGNLLGDQYRQQSFLDPTQLFQVAGTSSLGAGLADFINQQWEVTINTPTAFSGPSSLGLLRPDDLRGEWRRGTGVGAGVVVEWFESDAAGIDGAMLYVILVSTDEEYSALVDQVLVPALQAISLGT